MDTNTKQKHINAEKTGQILEISETKRVTPSKLITAEQHTNTVIEHAALPITGELTLLVQVTETVNRLEVNTDANTPTTVYMQVLIEN